MVATSIATTKPPVWSLAMGRAMEHLIPDFGGLLAIDAQGNVILRSLNQQPYDPTTEQFQQATESSPMLVSKRQTHTI